MPSLEEKLRPFADAHKGKAALAVKHLGTGETYTLHADDVKPTASLIKFPIMVEAYYQFAAGLNRPNDLVILHKADMVPGSGILTDHVTPGASFTLRDAVRMMIVWSDNTATNLVLDRLGIPATNKRMATLGLPETRINSKVYRRDTSVAIERSQKYGLGSTTANEQLKLLELLHAGKLVDAKASAEMIGHLKKCEDPDKYPRFLPYGTVIAMKTGSVDQSRTAAGILYLKKAGPVAVVALTSENTDKSYAPDNAGDLFCAKVAKAVYDHYEPK